MKSRNWFWIIIFNLPSLLSAQSKDTLPVRVNDWESKGALVGVSKPDEIDKLMLVIEGVASTREMLTEQSVKPYFMPPRKIGKKGTPLSYALASSMEYYLNLRNNFKDNLSPDYISLSTERAGQPGTIIDAFSFLAANGTVSAAIVPYEAANIPSSVYATQKYRIQNYLYLYRPTAKSQQKIFDTRKSLLRGNPIVVELQITNEFKTLKDTRYWHPEIGDKTPAGTHYVVVVGYDDERKSFELLNCWGAEWGNKGYIWISYDDYGKLAQNGFVLVPEGAF